MASTSSPPSPSWKHDVFLSFSGKDTRNSFTSHLYDALQRNQIYAFIDDKLDGGEKLEPALLKRIENSYISVVIFSENYADSTFCLRELSKILECKETKERQVLPVFHQLDPSQVQNLSGSYGEALSRHERDCASEEVERWRHALKEIANLKGWDSRDIKDETWLIQKIVSDIQKKLNHVSSPSINAERLVGMQSRVKHIESSLSIGSTGVLIVGIWGMGGIGKSKTAEAVYYRNSLKFEGRCFFRNVREESKRHGVFHVRQEILGDVLEKKDLKIRTTELSRDIKRMLQRKKVFIVLDDVSDSQHLNFLVGGDDLFGQGSRIIVTSRDRQVLINACQASRIYEVKNLKKGDALRLFSFHAFRQNNPPDGYTKLSKDVVSCAKGIPLVLEVLGANLYTKTSVEYWKSKAAQLRTNGGEDITKCLAMCYDELDRIEKKIFLDIACFFGYCTRDYLQQTLDLEERSGIDRLIDMCLIKIVENEIWMHEVLVKLGRDIVTQEDKNPRERSRLWDADAVHRVLTEKGTGKVESISLDLSETKEINASPAAFEGMYNLRLLKFYYPKEKIMIGEERVRIHLPGGLHFLSKELRILYWCDYPLTSLPSNFFPEKLVVLELPRSQLEHLWNDCQSLQHLPQLPSSLRVLIASDCISLTSVAGIFMQGCKDYETASQQFNFSGCLQLDQNSLTKIIGDSRLRIKRMEKSLFNQQYFDEPNGVRLCIPGSEVPEWFTYKNTGGPSVKIKLPAHLHHANTTDQLFGFILCAVVSFGPGHEYSTDFDIKCECHLITKDGTQSDLSFHYYKEDELYRRSSWKRDHVFIWSIHCHCSFNEASFHFKPPRGIAADAVVQSGVRPLFVEDCIDEPEQPQPNALYAWFRSLTLCLEGALRLFSCGRLAVFTYCSR